MYLQWQQQEQAVVMHERPCPCSHLHQIKMLSNKITYHLYSPTSNWLLRSSRLLISEKFSIFQVNLPNNSLGLRPAWMPDVV